MSTEPQQSQVTQLSTQNNEQYLKEQNSRIRSLLQAQSDAVYGKIITSFVGKPTDYYRFTQKCLGADCREGKMHLGETIEMVHYFVTTIDQIDEQTNEYRPAVYVVLVDAAGTATGFWSAFVARDLGRLIQALGEPSLDNPLPVRVVEASRPGKREWYTLELV